MTLNPARVDRLEQLRRGTAVAAVVTSDTATLRWLGIGEPEGVRVVISAGDGLVLDAERGSEAALAHALVACGLRDYDAVAFDGSVPSADSLGRASLSCVDMSGRIAAARAVKEPDEIDRIAGAAELVAVGQRALRDAVAPGMSELELWSVARQAMERAQDGPVAAAVDLMTGPRTALIGEPPTEARVEAGDPVLFDLAPSSDGYWADSCATLCGGEPSRELSRRHRAVRRALEAGLSAVRPGVRAGELDSLIRGILSDAGLDCPHHTGHGVGAAPQEQPWLVPGERTRLDEGMVIALEPGAYGDGFGVRLEHLVVVEADGASLLTDHELSLTR